MRDGYHRVLVAARDQRRERRSEVQAVGAAHRLPSGVNHGSQGPHERVAVVRPGERRVGTSDLGDVGSAQTPAVQEGAHPFPRSRMDGGKKTA